MILMGNVKVFGTAQVAAQLEMNIKVLQVWLQRNPDYYPAQRFNTDDLLWTEEDIERVKEARQRRRKTALV